MPEIAYVNGRYGPISEAMVSIDDRGYQFGDGVYEVITVFAGKPFLLEGHMARLARSLAGLRIEGVDMHKIDKVIRTLCKSGDVPRSKLYLSITRGTSPRNHIFPPGVRPNIIATIRPAPPAPAEFLTSGLSAITVLDLRWGRCDLKTLNLLWNVLARQKAEEAGAQEALLVAKDGTLRESSSANVFVVSGEKIFTHPCDEHILPGITRDLVISLARNLGMNMVEKAMKIDDALAASEIFLTGTIAELVAVTTVDGRPVGNGKPGPVTMKLRRAYDGYVAEFIAKN